HRLRNHQRKIRSLAALIELGEVADHRPSEDDNSDRGYEEDELGEQIERLAHLGRQHTHDNVHSNLSPRPGDNAIAEKHAAHHQEQHGLLGPGDGGIEEITTDHVREIEDNARDQQYS